MTELKVTKENFDKIREEGIGNGFKVINPADGYRKDNRLWFGNCSLCGERVTNSSLTGKGWEHELILEEKLNENGFRVYSHSRLVDYCPAPYES
jgi:hypothetical protein